MRSRTGFLAVVGAALMIVSAGCGGGGSSTPSPYAGAWVGVAGLADGSGSGGSEGEPTSIFMTVNSKGKITGTWSDPLGSGALSGEVSNGGTMTLNIAYAGPPPVVTSGRGVTVIGQDGNWQGSLPATMAEDAGMSIVFSAARQ